MEKRFKVGDTLTVRDKAECVYKNGGKGRYWFGGISTLAGTYNITRYGYWDEIAKCFTINIDSPTEYTMLESEFEEYNNANTDDNYDIY